MSIHTKPQKQQRVIGALYGAKFKFPGRQKIHFSKWGSTKFHADECENMVAEKPSWMAVESSRSLIVAFWTNGAYTRESLVAVPSLLKPSNKSYFPVKKKKAGKHLKPRLCNNTLVLAIS
ncbi:hypothetical protein Celaphus_00017562 [Cervus elaphus hippelaphus]|uniref:Uncharacterized protein n=1 Tax=Cervus elaphus hippelaphus TaxID=46360 RepID=A0A212C741_CEREH|nr:hypothetical protein Celaphus_00017562 [Cervus elaphus hippelaphus]